jgi:molybdopterin converting factor small subunit
MLTGGLSEWTGGVERVEIAAARIADLIDALYARFPALQGRLDQAAAAIDGEIHNQPRYLALEDDSEVHFLAPVSGG